MPVYVISRVAPKVGPAFEAYKSLAEQSITRHGGRYLARGGSQEVLEGEWSPSTVIVEFPSIDTAREWYSSNEYRAALKLRDEALTRDLVLVEGSPSPL